MFHVQNLYQFGPSRLSDSSKDQRMKLRSESPDHANCQIYTQPSKSRRQLLGSAVHTRQRHIRESVINLMEHGHPGNFGLETAGKF